MISPFDSERERAELLVLHHCAYMEEALANIDPRTLPDVERRRLLTLGTIPYERPETLGALLDEVQKGRRLLSDDNSPWQRVRFAALELEAMVAGIDYDVERKTYPANFAVLAQDEGLELLSHKRVHGTEAIAPSTPAPTSSPCVVLGSPRPLRPALRLCNGQRPSSSGSRTENRRCVGTYPPPSPLGPGPGGPTTMGRFPATSGSP